MSLSYETRSVSSPPFSPDVFFLSVTSPFSVERVVVFRNAERLSRIRDVIPSGLLEIAALGAAQLQLALGAELFREFRLFVTLQHRRFLRFFRPL